MHEALDVKGIVATGTGILNTATETGGSMGSEKCIEGGTLHGRDGFSIRKSGNWIV